MADYYAILTHIGEAKLANALALGEPLQITHMAVGDGEGQGAQGTPLPDPAQTALVSERRRAPLNTLTTDPANQNVLIAEQVIPEDVGGWWIREMGLFDADGDLIAVCNTPPTYKPVLASGSGRTQVVRMQLIVTDTAAVTLRVDPAVVLATRKYVDDQVADLGLPSSGILGLFLRGLDKGYEAITAQELADILDEHLPHTRLQLGKPTADPIAPITGSVLSGAMLAAGAIVETGVNANGNYVRWESGLQACWNYNFIIHPGTPPREPGVYSATWTFPASFISTSYYAGQTPTSTRPDLRGTTSVGGRSASSATIYRYDDSSASVTLDSAVVAIGMWK